MRIRKLLANLTPEERERVEEFRRWLTSYTRKPANVPHRTVAAQAARRASARARRA